ncbi:hypothetical protein J5X84_17475 [Streptosporangiaceae bacterium NEAU-GS5]|nr:hypothetical protein [Streptosporangiaceae bacterium NEAU-GS5]
MATACSAETASPLKPGTPAKRLPGDLLYADTSSGMKVVDTATGRTLGLPATATPDAMWNNLYAYDGSALLTLDAATGRRDQEVTAPGGQVIRAVSIAGTRVALGDPAPASPYGPAAARATTRLVIADATGRQKTAAITLDGNYEPDAFSSQGNVLFVLQYLPADDPQAYRVRALDLATGKVGPIMSRDKVPVAEEETMRGEGRVAVLAPGGGRLYTLYTHQPNHLHSRDLVAGRKTGVHAFVHVLDLEQQWAYCLDLPEPFGQGPAEGHTLATDGARLYVFDAGSGRLVVAHSDTLEIDQVAQLPPAPGPAHATISQSVPYLAYGSSLVAVDPYSLAVTKTWPASSPSRGLVPGPGMTSTLYRGVDGAAVKVDTKTGREVARVPIPGLTLLRHAALARSS